MKKLIFIHLIIFGYLFLTHTKPVRAHMDTMMSGDNKTTVSSETSHSESVEVVLQSILESQNVSTVQDLDLSKVSDDEWEKLGDAVMETYHPGQAHEIMDKMMGGEGSESLRQMHINMGKAYLGYGRNYGCGMIGNWNNVNTDSYAKGGEQHMMGNFGFGPMGFWGGGFGFIVMILFWGLVIFGVVAFLKWILNQDKSATKEKSALDIIKERYAKGEIDKKKFEEMKKELK